MAELTQLGGAPANEQAAPVADAPKQVYVTPKAVQKIREAFAREGVTGGLRLGVLGRRLLRTELPIQVCP